MVLRELLDPLLIIKGATAWVTVMIVIITITHPYCLAFPGGSWIGDIVPSIC